MRKVWVALTGMALLFLVTTGSCLAQFNPNTTPPSQKSKFDWDRLYIGGGLGLQFGTFTFIDVSPQVGYWFTDRFTAGVGGTYRYFEDTQLNYSTNVYGGGVFARYFFLEQLFAHVEYETLNGEWIFNEDRYFINSIFVGGGYMMRFGSSFAAIMLLYNINDSAFNPYSNPVIRFNFGIGL